MAWGDGEGRGRDGSPHNASVVKLYGQASDTPRRGRKLLERSKHNVDASRPCLGVTNHALDHGEELRDHRLAVKDVALDHHAKDLQSRRRER